MTCSNFKLLTDLSLCLPIVAPFRYFFTIFDIEQRAFQLSARSTRNDSRGSRIHRSPTRLRKYVIFNGGDPLNLFSPFPRQLVQANSVVACLDNRSPTPARYFCRIAGDSIKLVESDGFITDQIELSV